MSAYVTHCWEVSTNILNISKSHYNKSGCCLIKILQLTRALPGFLCHLNATWCVLAGDSWHYCMKQGKLCATVFEIVCDIGRLPTTSLHVDRTHNRTMREFISGFTRNQVKSHKIVIY